MQMPPAMLAELEKIAAQADVEGYTPTKAIFGALDKTVKPPAKPKKIKPLPSHTATTGSDETNAGDGKASEDQETGGAAAEQDALRDMSGHKKSAAATPRDSLRQALAKVKIPSAAKSLRSYGEPVLGKVAAVRAGNPIHNMRKGGKIRALKRKYFSGLKPK